VKASVAESRHDLPIRQARKKKGRVVPFLLVPPRLQICSARQAAGSAGADVGHHLEKLAGDVLRAVGVTGLPPRPRRLATMDVVGSGANSTTPAAGLTQIRAECWKPVLKF
jgi:hypothetical protein